MLGLVKVIVNDEEEEKEQEEGIISSGEHLGNFASLSFAFSTLLRPRSLPITHMTSTHSNGYGRLQKTMSHAKEARSLLRGSDSILLALFPPSLPHSIVDDCSVRPYTELYSTRKIKQVNLDASR